MLEEKLYLVTYEHKLEPYARTTAFSIGTTLEDAKLRLLSKDPQTKDLIIIAIQEFNIPGYKITLEKIV